MLERNGHLYSNVGLDGFDLVNSQETVDVIIPCASHHHSVNEVHNWTLWPSQRIKGSRPSATCFHDVSPGVLIKPIRITAVPVFGIGANPHARDSSKDVCRRCRIPLHKFASGHVVAKSSLTALEEPREIASDWRHSLDIHGPELRSQRVERDRHVQGRARPYGQDQLPRCISDPLNFERSRPRQYVRKGKRTIALSHHRSCTIKTNNGIGYGLPRRRITNGARNGDRVWLLLGGDLPGDTENDESQYTGPGHGFTNSYIVTCSTSSSLRHTPRT